MCMIARHAYALTYDAKYVQEWAKEASEDERLSRPAHLDEIEDEDAETLRKRYIICPLQTLQGSRMPVLSLTPTTDAPQLTVRPMTSFAWCFWQELIQLVNHELI